MPPRRLLPMTPAEAAARRQGMFVLPDYRGNNPHGTAESADHEGKRRNAQRYETIGELDRALDMRARLPVLEGNAPDPLPAQGGTGQGAGIVGALLLIGVGAVLAHVLMKGNDEDDGDGSNEGLSDYERERLRVREEVRAARAEARARFEALEGRPQSPPPPVVVVPTLPTQNPVAVAPPPAVIDAEFEDVPRRRRLNPKKSAAKPAPKRRRRKAKAEPEAAAPVIITTTVTPGA